jgi:menaquinone-dependent protoporphyrinogen IX oxidase
MKSIVIYNSQTGFTKKYADWIAEATGCEAVPLKKAGRIKLAEYDAVVFGSWCMAESVSKVAWFKKQLPSLAAAGKKLFIFLVGASPAEAPEVQNALRRNFTDDEWSKIQAFYCPGGLNYEKMGWGSRTMLKMFVKMLSNKKDITQKELAQVQMLSKSFDISDKKYIEPIVAQLKA